MNFRLIQQVYPISETVNISDFEDETIVDDDEAAEEEEVFVEQGTNDISQKVR